MVDLGTVVTSVFERFQEWVDPSRSLGEPKAPEPKAAVDTPQHRVRVAAHRPDETEALAAAHQIKAPDDARRLDELDEALLYHRRRQARADALWTGFWTAVPAAMIALLLSLQVALASIPGAFPDEIAPVVRRMEVGIFQAFLALLVITGVLSLLINRSAAQKVKQYARERMEVRARLRSGESRDGGAPGQ